MAVKMEELIDGQKELNKRIDSLENGSTSNVENYYFKTNLILEEFQDFDMKLKNDETFFNLMVCLNIYVL